MAACLRPHSEMVQATRHSPGQERLRFLRERDTVRGMSWRNILEEVEELDPKAAQEAFETLLPRLKALDKDKLAAVTVDVQLAAIVAAAVARWVQEDEIRARFALIPKALFDPQHLDNLGLASLACWYAAVRQLSATARTRDVQLPVALVQIATTTRKRMLELLDYHFGDDVDEGPELISIKRGSGFKDLANDLQRLAKMWLDHHDEIKDDRKHYQAGDGDAARKHTRAIMKLLGDASGDAATWTDLVARSWTLLLEIYKEVTDTAVWLMRHDSDPPTFPTLYAAGRKPRAKNKPLPVAEPAPAAEPEPAPTEEPAEPSEGSSS